MNSWPGWPGACCCLAYSVGFTMTEDVQDAIVKILERVWVPAYDAGRPGPARRVGRRAHRPAGPGQLAQGNAGHRPQGTPPPGAQLRFTDIDGHRFTCFVTSTKTGQLADLELRHRRRARCEDRILPVLQAGPRLDPAQAAGPGRRRPVDLDHHRVLRPAPARPPPRGRHSAALAAALPARPATPARVRRGFRSIRQALPCLAGVPKPGKPGPGRPPGSKNRRPATRHDVGKTVKRDEPKKKTRRQKG